MIIILRCNLLRGKSERLFLPNLSDKWLVPKSIQIKRSVEGSKKTNDAGEIEFDWEHATNINLIVSSDSNNIVSYETPFFEVEEVIDLDDQRTQIQQGHDISLTLLNQELDRDHCNYEISVTYGKTYGNIVYQVRTSDLSTVTTNISSACNRCSKVIFSFTRSVTGLELNSVIDRVIEDDEDIDDDWCDSLNLGANDEAKKTYVFDMTEDGFNLYSKMLKFMRLTLPHQNDDDDEAVNNDIYCYVVAYGFK